MKLVIITALIAVCSSAKLDRSYLPPPSASSAGGSHDSLQTPLTRSSSQESGQSAPIGSYTNNFQGVVVDAAAPGTRASADQLSGLGGPRPSYGSTDSKVGEAAFRGSAGFRGNAPNSANAGFRGNAQNSANAGFRGNAPNNANAGFRGNAQTNANGVGFDNRPERTQSFNGQSNFNGQTFSSESKPQTFANNGFPEATPERPQAYSDRNSNILAYSNDVDTDKYSYGFETDNGIAVGENGVAINGIVAQGGYSYKGDDGQVYKVTYVADEKGYRPVGDHLPTPPPIPQEILKSLEQNAKDEAAGLIDDGSYDAQKYNAEGDYTHHNGGDNSHNGAQLSQFGNRPESDAITSGTIINHNSQAFGKPASTQNTASGQFNGNQFGFQQQSAQANQGNGNSNGFQSSQFSQQTGNQFGSAAAPTRPNFAGVPNRFQASQSNQQSGLQSGTASIQGSSINRFQNTQTNQQTGFGNSGSQQFGQQANNFGSASAPTGQGSQTNGYQNTQFSQQAQFNNNNQQPSQFGFQSNSQSLSNKPSVGQSPIGQNLNGNAQNSQSYNGQAASSPNGFQQQTVNRFQSQFVQSQSNIQNQPSVGSFNGQQQQQSFGQQPNRFGSSGSINRFTQSNRFGGNNEYLPPTSDSTNTASSVSSQAADNGDSFPDFVALNKQTQQSPQNFASASASVGTQPSSIRRPVNTFPENQNLNNQAAQGASDSGIREQFGDVSKPTAIPDTELTTPFESNDKSPLNASPISQTTAIVGNFGAPSSNNFQQSEPNTQSTDEQPSSQTLSPVMPTSQPQPSNGFPNKPALSGNTQFSQTTYMSQENQQPSAYQGVDHSYFYNQPSKPFNTPFGRPQASRFPSTTSYQTNGFGSQTNQFVQQNSGSSNVQSPSTLGSIAPTAPTQFGQSQGFSANQNSGITQAAISSFPAVSPTSSNQFGAASNQFGLKPGFVQQSSSFNQQQSNIGSASFPSQSSQPGFPSQPVVPFNQATTPSPTDSQPSTTAPDVDSQTTQPDVNEPIVQNQQYDGTLYEYNKPPETLPASSDSDSSQTVQSIASQDNQAANAEGSKPQGIMETPETEQPTRNQASIPSSASASSFGNQAPNQFNQQQPIGSIQYSQASQSQGSFGQSQQNNQIPQSNKPFSSSFGSNFQGYPTAAASKPQVGFPIPQNSQQAFGSQGVQPSRGPSSIQGQGPIAQTTNTGFPKPQFGQNAQNNFGQNTAQYQGSQPSQQSFGLSSPFNQQNVATANSAAFNPSPFGQASAQASVSQNEPEVNPTFQPQTSFNQSPQSQVQNNQSQNPTGIQNGVTAEKKPIFNSACCRNTNGSAKPVQPNRGSTFTGFQGNNGQSLAGVGEDFSGPRQPPSFDDQTGYHY